MGRLLNTKHKIRFVKSPLTFQSKIRADIKYSLLNDIKSITEDEILILKECPNEKICSELTRQIKLLAEAAGIGMSVSTSEPKEKEPEQTDIPQTMEDVYEQYDDIL